jgi:hypothetical protein
MTTLTPAAATLDVSGTPRVSMSRLVGVELRKLRDTRAGLWLLVSIVAITALVITVFLFTAREKDLTFLHFMGVTATPQAFLLPVLGILLVTSEWSQRTALVTFTLEPVRGRVLVAKVIAAVVAGLTAIAIAMAVAAVATLLGGNEDAWVGMGADDVAKFALLQVSGILQGLAFGLVLLNSAAAIVLYFVLPSVFTIVSGLVKGMQDVRPWIDLGTSQQPLFSGTNLTGEQWAQLAVSTLLWVALPFLVGTWRVLRAEVK